MSVTFTIRGLIRTYPFFTHPLNPVCFDNRIMVKVKADILWSKLTILAKLTIRDSIAGIALSRDLQKSRHSLFWHFAQARAQSGARALTSWDSSVLTFLMEVSELCGRREIKMDRAGQPDGLGRLLQLAEAMPEKSGA
jgi:hypothetical protein